MHTNPPVLTRRWKACCATAIAALLCATTPGAQAQAYPAKPVRVIVGFTAGGPADTMARIIGQKVPEIGGQPVIIENRPGGNSYIAGEVVVRATPDAHVFWFSAVSALSFTYLLMAKPPIDPERDLALVTQAVSVPQIFVAHPSLQVKGLQDLARLAKQRPGQINTAIIGPGGVIHLGTELFKITAGINMNNVSYKGGANVITDLAGGHVEVALLDVPAIMSYLPTGRIRPLAVTSGARIPQLPQVPTTTEAGYPAVRSDSWYGIATTAATPSALVQRANDLWRAAVQAPETQQRLAALGATSMGTSVEDFRTFRAAETRKWGEVIKKIGFKLE